MKREAGEVENKGRTGKGRSLSALFALLRGNIRLRTSGWLPSGHTHTHTLADVNTLVVSGPKGAQLLLTRSLDIGDLNYRDKERKIRLHFLFQTL